MKIDVGAIIGTSLLYKNSVDYETLCAIRDILYKINNNYEILLTKEDVKNSVAYWNDFFRFTVEEKIILTESGFYSKRLISQIFFKTLEPSSQKDLFESIMMCGKELEANKPKIIKFNLKDKR